MITFILIFTLLSTYLIIGLFNRVIILDTLTTFYLHNNKLNNLKYSNRLIIGFILGTLSIIWPISLPISLYLVIKNKLITWN